MAGGYREIMGLDPPRTLHQVAPVREQQLNVRSPEGIDACNEVGLDAGRGGVFPAPDVEALSGVAAPQSAIGNRLSWVSMGSAPRPLSRQPCKPILRLANRRLTMQTQFNIHEAKSHLSRIIEQVEAGGEAVIARAGKPVVRLVLVGEAPQRRVLGRLEGRFSLPDEHAPPIPETPDDFIDAVEGR
jgi:prevent-host-death family protein